MLIEWFFNNTIPEFDAIEGVDSDYLRNTIKMKEPAIILSYGMLTKDPKVNSNYLKNIRKYNNKFKR